MFHKNFTPTYQKGRRVPINLQPLVNDELKKLHAEKHIIKQTVVQIKISSHL